MEHFRERKKELSLRRLMRQWKYMPSPDHDWRLRGQERYLNGVTLHRANYRAPSADWDHDHCDFCWAKFMEGNVSDTLQRGYVTDDGRDWICPNCFDDFRERFHWTVKQVDAS